MSFEELRRREPILHHTPEARTLDPDEASWVVSDFQAREIAADNYLVTYMLAQGTRITRRATLWRKTAAGWKMVETQG